MGKGATETWMENLKPEDLDLHQLDASIEKAVGVNFDDFSLQDDVETKKRKEEYKKKYGSGWMVHYFRDTNLYDYDVHMKDINTCIYMGEEPYCQSTSMKTVQMYKEKAVSRMLEIYGDDYMMKNRHEAGDEKIAELLIRDAIKTGRWKELPDCLQAVYHEQIKLVVCGE